MFEAGQLSQRAQRYLLTAVGTACNVHSRSDLYMWARGPFWAAFPHEIMLCAVQNEQGTVTQVECLHSDVLPIQLIADLCDTQSGFMVRVQRMCRENGLRELQLGLPPDSTGGTGDTRHQWLNDLTTEWNALNLGQLWWGDTGTLPAGHSTCSAIIGPQLAQNSDACQLLNLMIGPMHLAFTRALCGAEPKFEMHAQEKTDLTERQMEIMRWVRLGKTNHEIASIMEISPFTVKNHVQKMFKRMNVHNRAQAVARSAGLLAFFGLWATRFGERGFNFTETVGIVLGYV